MKRNTLFVVATLFVAFFAFVSCEETTENDVIHRGKMITNLALPNGVRMWQIDPDNIPKDSTIYKISTLDDLYKLVTSFLGNKKKEKPIAYYDRQKTISLSNPYLSKLEAIANPEANPVASYSTTFSVSVDSVNVHVKVTSMAKGVSSQATGSNPFVTIYGWREISSSSKVDTVRNRIFYIIQGNAFFEDTRRFYAWYDYNHNGDVDYDENEYVYVELEVKKDRDTKLIGDLPIPK